jgi:hypothetical protein
MGTGSHVGIMLVRKRKSSQNIVPQCYYVITNPVFNDLGLSGDRPATVHLSRGADLSYRMEIQIFGNCLQLT